MAEPQVDDRRAALEAAFDQAEQEASSDPEVDSPAGEDPPIEAAPPATDGTPPEPGIETEVEPAKPSEETPPEPAKGEGVETAQEPPEPVAEPQSDLVAPVGWRGAAKQKWANAPKEIQEEVIKREREIGGALREAAEARQFQTKFQETIRPFESIIAAQGSDALTATRNMMQTGAALVMGTPAQKAQTVAQIVQQYGVDIDHLAAAIDGQAPAEGAPGNGAGAPDPAMQRWMQQQLAPVQQLMSTLQQREQQQHQQIQHEAATDIETFSVDPKNVYFEDVRDTMGDLMEVAGRQGRELSLQQAYDTACRMNPQIAPHFQAQQGASSVQEARTAAERRAAAASSIAPRAQPASMPEPKDRREAIEQAWQKAEQGG